MPAIPQAEFLRRAQTGDVLLFRGRGLCSRVIELWTGQPYSHAAIVLKQFDVHGSRLCIFEATHHYGVRLYPLERYLTECARQHCQVDWYPVTSPEVHRDRIAAVFYRAWGDSYVNLAQFLVSFGRLTRWLRRRLGGRAGVDLNPSRHFCSELVAEALEAGDCFPAGVQAPVLQSPGDITRFGCLVFAGTIGA